MFNTAFCVALYLHMPSNRVPLLVFGDTTEKETSGGKRENFCKCMHCLQQSSTDCVLRVTDHIASWSSSHLLLFARACIETSKVFSPSSRGKMISKQKGTPSRESKFSLI